MTMTTTLQQYLASNSVAYDIVPHRMTFSSMNTAQSVHIHGELMAKPVILEDETGYLMAVVPANRHVKISKLNKILNRKMVLASETELSHLFTDCDLGAIPPIASAYGMACIVDDELLDCPDIYFEAGNHQELVHINGRDFKRLMKGAPHSRICMH